MAIGAQIIYAAHMVVMHMGGYHGIEVIVGGSKHLHTKVGTTVYKYGLALGAYQRRAAHSAVARIGRLAHRTLASHHGHSGRCACTQKLYLYRLLIALHLFQFS